VKLTPRAQQLYRLQDYGSKPRIAGVVVRELEPHADDAGSLTELVRLREGRVADFEDFLVAQVNYSTLEPGSIKAFHIHRRQTDVWFVPPEDRVLLVLVDVREGSLTEAASMRLLLGAGRSRLVRIPPGVAHGCRNLGATAATIVYFTDLPFSPDPSQTDEGRLPWDFLGPGVWEVSRE
jgi:dTDP-4-dehydrorhamnose 3,5-epimerase